MYFSYCIESKDFIYVFSNCSCKKKKVSVVQLYFHINSFSCAKWPRGYICIWTDPLNDTGSNHAIDVSLIIFFVRIKYAFFHWFENQYFCCCFKVVLLMLFKNKYTIHIYIYILKRKWTSGELWFWLKLFIVLTL